MSDPIDYIVEAVSPQAHLFRVTLSVPAPRASGEVLRLPAWIPGSYMIREFARNIVDISAEQDGRKVALSKTDKHTWRTAALRGEAPLVVVATVYAWDLSVRCAHLDQTHAFFNGTQLFLCVEGREDVPHRVDIRRPEGDEYASWKVATTLPAAGRGKRGVDRAGFGLRLAQDYDALIDHPVEMGTFARIAFDAQGVAHEMVLTGQVRFDADRLTEDLQKICEQHIRLFEEDAPFDRYLFMTLVVGDGYGGLEHRDSTALICSRGDLPVSGVERQEDAYRNFLGLCSHEYFHSWNVKRIKPAAFVPYRLWEENYTRLLWVFEGFTSYYDDLALVRSGVLGVAEYLALLSKTFSNVERTPGRHKQSAAESSYDAWVKYYRQDENSPNAIVSYYTKGALVAAGLDLTIRAKTGGRKSLDDVMRMMWQEHGKTGVGLAEDAMPALIKAATGVDVRREIARWAEGTDDVPMERLLKPFGVSLRRKRGAASSGLGIKVRNDAGAARLANVYTGGSAQAAGLSAGDEIVAIDALRVNAGNLEAVLGRLPVGALLKVHAFRRDELMQFAVRLAEPSSEEGEWVLAAQQSPEARSLREAWLGV